MLARRLTPTMLADGVLLGRVGDLPCNGRGELYFALSPKLFSNTKHDNREKHRVIPRSTMCALRSPNRRPRIELSAAAS